MPHAVAAAARRASDEEYEILKATDVLPSEENCVVHVHAHAVGQTDAMVFRCLCDGDGRTVASDRQLRSRRQPTGCGEADDGCQ